MYFCKKLKKMKIGFDNEKYQNIQSQHIKERISQFDGSGRWKVKEDSGRIDCFFMQNICIGEK